MPVAATVAMPTDASQENRFAARAVASSGPRRRSVRSRPTRPPIQSPTAATWRDWMATSSAGLEPAAAWLERTSASRAPPAASANDREDEAIPGDGARPEDDREPRDHERNHALDDGQSERGPEDLLDIHAGLCHLVDDDDDRANGGDDPGRGEEPSHHGRRDAR